MDEIAGAGGADRGAALAEALRERTAALERAQRDADALRADLAVRDGYLADLRARLTEAEERADQATRVGEVARERLSQLASAAYVHTSIDENLVRQRIAAAILRVSELKDRERAQALRALRELRRR